MGLPIFVAPPSPDTAASGTDKAGTPRSAIRRQRTLRGNRARRSPGYESRRRRLMALDNALGSNNMPSMISGDYEDEEQELVFPPDEPDLPPDESDEARRNRIRVHYEQRMRLRESFERQNPLNTEIDGPLMPPVPESRDYATTVEERRRELERSHIRDLRRMARRHPAPTPSYADVDVNRRVTYHYTGAERQENSMSMPASLDASLDAGTLGGEAEFNPPYDLGTQPSPPLGRVSADRYRRAPESYDRGRLIARRMRAQLRGHMDGLGDRDRSLSPDGGTAAWDTLLRTITPDPQPPSASSSFASASASAGVAASNTAPASANTSMTSRGIEAPRTAPDCDISDSSDGEDALQEGRERFWRQRPTRNNGSGEINGPGGMQEMLSRLAAREDISDEWWAGAGLRREPTS